MSHYKANLRDIEFSLFEVLGIDKYLGTGIFEDADRETVMELFGGMAQLAEGPLADSFLDSDRNPPVYDPKTYSVTTPDTFKKAYQQYVDSEFWRLDVQPELGGMGISPTVRWAAAELILGSNPAIHMYAATYAFARVLFAYGNEEQKKLAQLMIDKGWGATMVLTEPDAGSDVGAGRAKAVQLEDGTWKIDGVKRFITSGETDLFENIIHLVLARPEGAGPGTKGLSLFVVPKYHFDLETGELGERNGAFVTNVEHKMGLKVSTTCELRFSEVDGIPGIGKLMGDVHDGIAQMFHVIEGARMMVGTKAIATLSAGYLNALDYAKNRVQGPDLTQAADKNAPRVTITAHPDVRRSLMTQKAFAEGMRSLIHFCALQQDKVMMAVANGERDELAEAINDLLLPVVKGYGSERSWVLLGTETLQTFGGSGFLQDYPIEQYIRDSKIDTLYEGTTAIQGLDFFFRKIVKNKGVALGAVAAEITEFVKGESGDDALATERELLGKALEDVQGMVGYMIGQAMASDTRNPGTDVRNIYKVGQNSTRLLMGVGDVVIAWLLLRGAEVAQARLAEGDLSEEDTNFYTGKVAAARFFTRQILPKLAAERAIAEGTDNDLMDVPEAAF